MEKLNQAVTEVSQLLVDQHVEISNLSQENKELEERIGMLKEELRQCKAEIVLLSNLKKKNHLRTAPQKLFGWF
jgi:uncharacterized small protein (DUF1192 family)